MSPFVRSFYDRATGSLRYVFHCPAKRHAASVDPARNYNPAAGTVTTQSADEILDYVCAESLEVV